VSPCRFASPYSAADKGPLSEIARSAGNTPATPSQQAVAPAEAAATGASSSSPMHTPVRLMQRLSPRKLLSPLLAALGQRDSPLRRTASDFLSTGAAGGSSSSQAPFRRTKSAAANMASAKEMSLAAVLGEFGEAVHALNRYDCKAALKVLAALPSQQRQSAFALQLEARCYFEMSDHRRAADVYKKLCDPLKASSGRTAGLEYYSTALWHLGERLTLGHLAQRLLEGDRLQPQVWCVVGNCFSLQGDHEQAKKCFRRAVQLDPSFAYGHTLMAHECVAAEDFDKAVQLYQRAIGLDSRHYNAWWGLGNVYCRQEEYKKARQHFQQAVAINGSSAVMKISLGTVHQSLGELPRALALFSSAAESQQCKALAFFQRGTVLNTLGRHDEATEELTKALRLAPREAKVHLQLGRAHAGTGNKRHAFMHYNMAMELSGGAEDFSKERQAVLAAQTELLRSTAAAAPPAASSSSQGRARASMHNQRSPM